MLVKNWRRITEPILRPYYWVASDGRIKSVRQTPSGKKHRLLLPSQNYSGYFRITLQKRNGKTVTRLIHRLVAIEFIPNPSQKPEVNHKDGKKSNNVVGNLEWTTRTENQIHARKTGLFDILKVSGEASPKAKLTNKQVLEIRHSKKSSYEISKEFKVSQRTVRKIITRERWKHI